MEKIGKSREDRSLDGSFGMTEKHQLCGRLDHPISAQTVVKSGFVLNLSHKILSTLSQFRNDIYIKRRDDALVNDVELFRAP